MIESNFRVLEFSKEDFENLVRNTVAAELQKIYGMVNNIQNAKFKTQDQTNLIYN